MRHWVEGKLSVVLLVLVLAAPLGLISADFELQAALDPGDAGPCDVSSQVVDIGGDLRTYVYYPAGSECSAELAAPYPGIALAHGFSMFGLIDMARGHAGDGEHLASWGYVVAIPVLPDDPEERVVDVQNVLSYLEVQTGTPGSFLRGIVDVERLAVAGHSFGGASVLAVAARDPRVKAVLSMDPVYHQSGPFAGEEPAFWDPEAEGPRIQAPTCILGAPSSNCNSEADYSEIYPFVGAVHRALLFIVGASHCDFMDPGYAACSFVCEGDTDPARTQLTQKYTTAWFNYYLHLNAQSYRYLYGSEADADIAAGRIQAQWDTAPRGFTGQGMDGSTSLRWGLYEHPIVAGYNIYRRPPDQSYAPAPDAQAGRVSTYLDDGLAAGQVYFYTVRSRDLEGNEHQAAAEVRVVVQGDITPTASPTPSYTPSATPSASATRTPTGTPARTRTPAATPSPTPTRTRTGPGPCRLYLPAVFVGAGGAQALMLRQRRWPPGAC